MDGSRKTGVRPFPEPMNLEDIKQHAWQLAAEVLGRGVIEHVDVMELSADHPTVVALILGQIRRESKVLRSNGTLPYLKEQRRKPRH